MKIIFIAVFLVAGLCQSHAQLHVGAQAGANLTKMYGTAFSHRFKLGHQLGGYGYYDFTNFFGLELAVQFSQSNTKVSEKYKDVLLDAFDKGKKLNYINVPILLRLNSHGILTLVGGPQFSILTDRHKSILENGKNLFKSKNIALVTGFDLNLRPLVIYGRYLWGVSKVSNVGRDANSRQIQIGLGIELF